MKMKRMKSGHSDRAYETTSLTGSCGHREHERELLNLKAEMAEQTRRLRESEEIFRNIFAGISDAALIFEPSGEGRPGRFLEVNEAACERLGYTREELLALTPRDIVEPGECERLARRRDEIENRRSILTETIHVGKDGREIPVESRLRRFTYLGRPAILSISRDIGGRNEGKETEKKYRLLTERMNDTLWTRDLGMKITYISPSVEKVLGFTVEERMKQSAAAQFTPSSLEQAARILDDELRHDGERDPNRQAILDMECYHKDGSVRCMESALSFIRDEEGRPVGVQGLSRDVTDYRRAEKSLRESEDKFRILAETTPTAILMYQGDKWIYANPAAEKISGYEARELLAMNFWDIIHPEDQEPAKKIGRRRQRAEDAALLHELRIVARDGQVKWVEVASAATTIGGHPAGILSVIDMTARKRTEAKLRESERQLGDIIDFLPDATLVANPDGRVVAWNRAIVELTGVEKQDMLGKGDREYALPFYGDRRPILIDLALHPDLEQARRYASLRREDDIIYGEAHCPNLPPGDVHIAGTARVLRDDDGRVVAAIECIQNVTERKRMEERLKRAEKMEALGQLAGGVAHDLNNVLGALVGYSELLLNRLPPQTPLRRYGENILQAGLRGAAIIDDLLTLARRGVHTPEILNLNHIITNYLASPEFKDLTERRPQLQIRPCLERELLNIKGSPVHLRKALMNLAINAAEAVSGPGEVTITTRNRHLDRTIRGYDEVREGDYVVMSVADTGRGIARRDMEKIFEPFYTKKVMGRSGTGLGLSVVWGTVKDHGGYIDVESEEGGGSAFALYFPATREAPAGAGPVESPAAYKGRGEFVLVVDDVPEQREVAAGMLERLGYRVETAAGGEEAIRRLGSGKADLVILDMIMDPGIGGLETYRRIIAIHPHQKAVLVSGFSESDHVREAQRLGAGTFVRKPYVMARLGAAVRQELDRRPPAP